MNGGLKEGETLLISGKGYQVLAKIGSGTFGEVYLSQDETGRRFAIKILHIQPAASRIASFKNEFLILTQLKHPFLCQAHDLVFSEPLNQYLFVSDYASGEPFFEATRGKSFSEIERLAIQVLEVLDYLHLHDVIHFDIKCPNIMVGADGSVKLLDFGLAHLKSLPLKKFPGSLRYAAPEILLRSRSTDHRTDLYSFGIVLYRALTGRFPFDENDPSEIIDWHLHNSPSWTREEQERIPDYMRKLVEFLLKKIPAERLARAHSAINWIRLHGKEPAGPARSYPNLLPSEGPLVARDKELEAARQAIESPSGQTFLFTGEKGIGKTRLLKEIKYMAEVKELRCLWFDNFAQRDGFSQLAQQLSLPAHPSPIELFETSLTDLQTKTPLILFMDDLHEADPYFWEWIAKLHDRRLPVCLFLGWEGTPPTGSPLVPLFQTGRVIPLAPFGRKDLETYLSDLLDPGEETKKLIESVYHFSSGIPLLVMEGVRFLRMEKGQKLPSSIEKLYESELAPLSQEALEILKTLAIWKRPVTLEELSLSVPMEIPHIVPLMPHLLSKGLIVRVSSFNEPSSDLEILYRLPNAALSLVLQQGQTEEQKRGRMGRILSILETKGNASLEELADTSRQAGVPAKARRYLWELAQNYETSFQTQKAIPSYEEALKISEKEPLFAYRIRKKLIPLLVLAGRPSEALALFPARGPLPLPDLKLKGWVFTRIGRFREATGLYQKGIDGSEEKDPMHRELLNDLANVYLHTGQTEKATRLFRQTLPDDSAPIHEKFSFLANNNLGLALALVGKIEEAREFEQKKLDLFKKIGDEHQIPAALSQLGFIELKGQNLPQATSFFEEALSLSEKSGDLHNILVLLDNLIAISQKRGLYHRALDYFSKAIGYRSAVGAPYQIHQNYLKGAFLYLTMGLPEPAGNYLVKLDAALAEGTIQALKGWVALAWGYTHRAKGNLTDSARKFRESIAFASDKKDWALIVWGHYALADLFLEEKKLTEAAREYRKGIRWMGEVRDDELKIRFRLLNLLLQMEGAIPAENSPVQDLQRLAEECEGKGMVEVAGEAYGHVKDRRAKEIYLEIASALPEEYRIAYLGERFRREVLEKIP